MSELQSRDANASSPTHSMQLDAKEHGVLDSKLERKTVHKLDLILIPVMRPFEVCASILVLFMSHMDADLQLPTRNILTDDSAHRDIRSLHFSRTAIESDPAQSRASHPSSNHLRPLGPCHDSSVSRIVLYLSGFYRRHELQMRVGFFFSAAAMSGAFSGLLAAAIVQMDGLREAEHCVRRLEDDGPAKETGGFNGTKTQLFTVPPFAIAFVATMIAAYAADRYKARGITAMITSLLSIAGYALFLRSNSPAAHYTALCLMITGIYSTCPSLISWMPNNAAASTKRATAVAMAFISSNSGGILSTWNYPESAAPGYKLAAKLNLAFSCITVGLVACEIALLRWKNQRKQDDLLRDAVLKPIQELSPEEQYNLLVYALAFGYIASLDGTDWIEFGIEGRRGPLFDHPTFIRYTYTRSKLQHRLDGQLAGATGNTNPNPGRMGDFRSFHALNFVSTAVCVPWKTVCNQQLFLHPWESLAIRCHRQVYIPTGDPCKGLEWSLIKSRALLEIAKRGKKPALDLNTTSCYFLAAEFWTAV
ncbi:6724_t:CDS:2, partial [Scutellospora calospora]